MNIEPSMIVAIAGVLGVILNWYSGRQDRRSTNRKDELERVYERLDIAEAKIEKILGERDDLVDDLSDMKQYSSLLRLRLQALGIKDIPEPPRLRSSKTPKDDVEEEKREEEDPLLRKPAKGGKKR